VKAMNGVISTLNQGGRTSRSEREEPDDDATRDEKDPLKAPAPKRRRRAPEVAGPEGDEEAETSPGGSRAPWMPPARR
jgi:hypothetical protein